MSPFARPFSRQQVTEAGSRNLAPESPRAWAQPGSPLPFPRICSYPAVTVFPKQAPENRMTKIKNKKKQQGESEDIRIGKMFHSVFLTIAGLLRKKVVFNTGDIQFHLS